MLLFWIIFLVFVIILLVLDLGVFHKSDKAMGVRESLVWTGVSIGYSLTFCGVIYLIYENGWGGASENQMTGGEAALQYLTGYVIEKALSIDNVFVMAAIFSYFGIPAQYQHRVLFWGILGAVLLRGIFILSGAALLRYFHWAFYLFGAVLVISAFRMFRQKEHGAAGIDLGRLANGIGRFIPITQELRGHKLLYRRDGRWMATPLLVALLVIEFSDVLFAMDSIPAIFAVTQDPFIVFTSNIMAVLGLRSLYFAVAAMLRKFEHLKYSLAFILLFVGLKMLLMEIIKIPTLVSLGIILFLFLLGLLG